MIKFFAITVPAFHPPFSLVLSFSLLLFALLLSSNYFRFLNAILLPTVITLPFSLHPRVLFYSASLSFA